MMLNVWPVTIRRPALRFACVGLLLSIVVAGCGDNDAPQQVAVYPVKGKVLLADGKPLKNGRVVFVAKDGLTSAMGKLGEAGTFTLSQSDAREGAPAGEYKVRIEPDESTLPKAGRGASARPGSLPFPSRYTDEDASELTATVKAGTNDLPPFTLSKNPAKSSAHLARH